eukprot:15480689-Alexandrium_andersonii.AAC.1
MGHPGEVSLDRIAGRDEPMAEASPDEEEEEDAGTFSSDAPESGAEDLHSSDGEVLRPFSDDDHP